MSLFWRVFVTNAALLVVAAIVLGVSPITVSWPIALTEAVVLTFGLVAMLVANALLLRPAFQPLERLARRMGDVDLLRPGQRFAVAARGEILALVAAFNQMLERLEAERRESGRRAVAAQEAERKRVASELHDEVGQAMTGVLMLLARLQDAVVPERRRELADAQEAIRGGLEEVRRIAQELRPELLEHLGLVSALRGLALLLNREPDFEVVAEAADGAEAVEKALAGEVGLVILAVAMPRMSGLQAARELARRRPGLQMVMLSMYDNEQFLFEALRAGASGYVLKSGADRDIVDACRAAMRGESFLYPSAVTALVRDFVSRTDRDGGEFDVLTLRELEVVKLIAEGHTSREIAAELVISVKTVERHRANILEKLGMRDRVELTRYAIRRGLIEP